MSEETALTVQNQNLTLPNSDTYILTPSKLILTQTNHVDKFDDAIPGAFRDVESGKNFVDEKRKPIPITLVPLEVMGPRVLFEDDDLNKPPICRSLDGVVPISGALATKFGLTPQHTDCKTCPKNDWKHFHDAKHPLFRIPPDCRERPRLKFCDVDDEIAYIITFTSKSVSPFKTLVKNILKEVESAKNKNKRNPNFIPYSLYDFTVEMSSEKTYNTKGQMSYKVFFKPIVRVAEIGKYQELYQKYVVLPKQRYGSSSEEQQEGQILEGEVVE